MPSVAEPAHPDGPEHTTAGPPGKLLHLAHRTARTGRTQRTPRRPAALDDTAPATPQQRLAETAEAWFLARGTTLTDDTTAETYRTTLDLVRLMLEGSLDQNLIGQDEHRHLTGMVEGLRYAPDAL